MRGDWFGTLMLGAYAALVLALIALAIASTLATPREPTVAACRVTSVDVEVQKHEDEIVVGTDACGTLRTDSVAFATQPLEVGSAYEIAIDGDRIASATLIDRG